MSVVSAASRLARSAFTRGTGLLLSPLGSVVAVATRAPLVALTMDDGPDPDVTPRVLDALATAGARATFFVLMTRVHAHPGIVRELVAQGHEVGLHGADHRRLTDFGRAEVADRLTTARQELQEITGRPVRWFRPPYGAQLPATALAIRTAGLVPVLWGPSLWDWKDVDPLERRARALRTLQPGAIVLGHDGIAGPGDGDPAGRAPSLDRAAWVAEMVQEYRARGLEARSLSEVVATGRAIRRARFVR